MQDDGISNAFRYISSEQLDQFRQLMPLNDDEAMDMISRTLGLDNAQQDTRQHLRLSLTIQALQFAAENQFSNVKTGVIFNIIQTLMHSIHQGDDRDSCERCMSQSGYLV